MAHVALQFMQEAAAQRQPCFVLISTTLQHSPKDYVRMLTVEPRGAAPGELPGGARLGAGAFNVVRARALRARVLQLAAKAGLVCAGQVVAGCDPAAAVARGRMVAHPDFAPAAGTLPGHGGGVLPASWVDDLIALGWLDASLEELLQHARRSGSLVAFTSDREPLGQSALSSSRDPFLAASRLTRDCASRCRRP